ncbi:MAG: hypothetical protein IKI05_04375 [Bacteroidaceae bacterium]|nr:hypothetical protein [Bacteroidaceae bacterium]
MKVRTLDVVDVAAEVVAEASADGIEADFGAMPAVEVFSLWCHEAAFALVDNGNANRAGAILFLRMLLGSVTC